MPVSPPLQGARLTLERASRLLSSGKLTSLQLCAYCHELADFGDQPIPTIAEGNRNEAGAVPPCGLGLNAFAQISSREELFRDAAESDRRRAAGLALGALDGIPVSIKANIAAKGWILSAASRDRRLISKKVVCVCCSCFPKAFFLVLFVGILDVQASNKHAKP